MVEKDSLDYKKVLIAKTRNTYKYEEIMKRAEVVDTWLKWKIEK